MELAEVIKETEKLEKEILKIIETFKSSNKVNTESFNFRIKRKDLKENIKLEFDKDFILFDAGEENPNGRYSALLLEGSTYEGINNTVYYCGVAFTENTMWDTFEFKMDKKKNFMIDILKLMPFNKRQLIIDGIQYLNNSFSGFGKIMSSSSITDKNIYNINKWKNL